MRAAIGKLPSDGYLIKNEYGACFVGDATNFLQEMVLRLDVVYRLHHDGREILAGFLYYCLELPDVVVVEGQDRAAQALRHAGGQKPREQVLLEAVLAREVGREIPVVPAVVAAKGDDVLAGISARDALGNGHCLPAAARIAHHVGPWMNLA